MSKFKIIVSATAFLFAILLTIALIWTAKFCNMSIDNFLFPKIVEMKVSNETFFDAIILDLKTLEKLPIFKVNTYQNDAEKILGTYVSWTGENVEPLKSASHLLIRSIAKDYPTWRSKPELLLQLSQDRRLDQIDTHWMTSLSTYDHWDVFKQSLVKAGVSEQDSGLTKNRLMANGPAPDYAELSNWALAHFIKLHKSGKISEAYQSYRKVTELIHSSNTLLGNMVAFTMLRGENSLLQTFPFPERAGYSTESIEAYKRVSWGWVPLIMRTHFFDFPTEFKPFLKAHNGLCGGLNEAIRFFPALQEYLLPHFPFEKNFSNNMISSRNFQKQLFTICGMQKHESYLITPTSGFFVNSQDSMDPRTLIENSDYKPTRSSTTINAAKIPYVRQALALLNYSVGVPNYLKYYQDQKN